MVVLSIRIPECAYCTQYTYTEKSQKRDKRGTCPVPFISLTIMVTGMSHIIVAFLKDDHLNHLHAVNSKYHDSLNFCKNVILGTVMTNDIFLSKFWFMTVFANKLD